MNDIAVLKMRKKYLVKKAFKDTFAYKYILKYFYPAEGSKIYAYYQKLLSKAMVHTSVENFWGIKLLVLVVWVIVLYVVLSSNRYYQANEVITKVDNKSSMLFASAEIDAEQEAKEKEIIEQEKRVFEALSQEYSYQTLPPDQVKATTAIMEFLIKNNLEIRDELTEDTARRMYKKLVDYYAVQDVDYLGPMILIVFAFFIPEAYLMFRAYMMKYYIYNEYLRLEVTAIMVGKLEPIKVEEILNVLSDNSKYFKRYIDEVRFNYFNVQNGNSKAFDSVLEKVSHKELKYLLKALKQAAEADLKMTIENLENQRKSNKEFRNIKEQSKLKKKELIGILVIFVVLAAVCVYCFAPFEAIMNDFSI